MKIKNLFAIAALALTVMTFGLTGCDTDPCKDVVCENGGSCVDGDCICAAGYEGVDCSTESRTKMLGAYTAAENCDGVTDSYTVNISASSTEVTRINFDNFYALNSFFGVSTPVYGEVSGSTITIPSQNMTGGPSNIDFTVSGSGTYSEATGGISFTFTMVDNANNDSVNCTADYTAQ